MKLLIASLLVAIAATSASASQFNPKYIYDIPKADRSAVLAYIKKQHATNPACTSVDYGSQYQKKKGVFFIDCTSKSGKYTRIDYTMKDVIASQKKGSTVKTSNTPWANPVEACNLAIKNTFNSGTPSIFGSKVTKHANGRQTVYQDFKYKSFFGQKKKATAKCLVFIDGRVEISKV